MVRGAACSPLIGQGHVKVVFNIVTKDLAKLGYDTSLGSPEPGPGSQAKAEEAKAKDKVKEVTDGIQQMQMLR